MLRRSIRLFAIFIVSRELSCAGSDVGRTATVAPAPAAPSGTEERGSVAAPSADAQLSRNAILSVVQENQPSVKRKCWQPALEACAREGPTSAEVRASITIASSGAVQTAIASGAEKDFPTLAGCITDLMKAWRFPPSIG